MHIRRTTFAALLAAGSLALTACGSSEPAPAAPGGPTEISVSLFGTFGYDEVGLFKEYEAANPGITIRYESTQGEDKYWPALQTRLASGSGVSDVQGIEVGAHRRRRGEPGRPVDRPARHPRERRDRPLHRLEGEGRDHQGRRGARPRHRHRPDGHLLPHRPARAGRAADRPAQLAGTDARLERLPRPRREVQGRRPRPAPPGTTPRAASTTRSSPASSRSTTTRSGNLVYATNPAVRQAFDTAAKAGQAGPDRQARAVRRPRLGPGLRLRPFATIACPSWMIGYIKGKAGDAGAGKWNVTPLPGGAGGNWGGSYLGIPASSPHKEEAAELITWLTAPEQQAKVFAQVGNFPSTTQAISDVAGATDPYFNGAPIGQIFSKSATAAPVQILGPQDGVVKNAMTQALLAVETGGATPDAALGRRRHQDRQPGRLMTSRASSTAPAHSRPPGSPLPPAAGAPRPRHTARGASRLHAAPRGPHAPPYAYVAPFFAIFLAFGLFPLVYTAWISLHRYRLGSRMSWVGLDNYAWLFTNPSFYNALWKTVHDRRALDGPAARAGPRPGPPAQLPAARADVPARRDADALRHLGRRGDAGLRADLRPGRGAGERAARRRRDRPRRLAQRRLDGPGRDLGDRHLAVDRLQRADLPGRHAVDRHDLYEAAALDGANRWQQFLHVTLPGLRPTILFTVVVSTIGASQLFGEPLLFGGGQANGGPANQYQTLGLFMYQQGWQFGQLGRAATVAWVMFVLIVGAGAAQLLDRPPEGRLR